MLDFIYLFYINYLWTPFLSLIKSLEKNPDSIFILIIILVIIAVIQTKMIKRYLPKPTHTPPTEVAKTYKKLKLKKLYSRQTVFILLDKLITFLCVFIIALIVGVVYIRYKPEITDFFKTNSSSETTPSNNQTTTPSTTTQQITPTYRTEKRLYYYCSCSSCWAEGCSHNGYSYGGYDSYYYSYYYGLCKACRCNSFNAGSFWK